MSGAGAKQSVGSGEPLVLVVVVDLDHLNRLPLHAHHYTSKRVRVSVNV
jgi:hypothetical protein